MWLKFTVPQSSNLEVGELHKTTARIKSVMCIKDLNKGTKYKLCRIGGSGGSDGFKWKIK